jgi:uncharacterized protein (DUF58 family)
MAGPARAVFPLISRRRGAGWYGVARTSTHRGGGYEVVSSRPYRRGDSMRSIDWMASARLSSARDSDEFVVREHFSEESPRVVLLVDRRPEMSLYPPELPWLCKPAAVAAAGRMIVDSALATQGVPGYLDLADPAAPRWLPPRRRQDAALACERELARDAFTAPADNLEQGLRRLERLRHELPAGSFVFVISDFLVPPPGGAWRSCAALGWEVVPVIVQDPLWEQSFPDVSGFALPIALPGDGRLRPVRLTRREAAARKQANERRLADLLARLARHELDPVVLGSSDPGAIFSAFMTWYERRDARLRRR